MGDKVGTRNGLVAEKQIREPGHAGTVIAHPARQYNQRNGAGHRRSVPGPSNRTGTYTPPVAEPAPLSDPLHRVSGPGIAWTRVNIAEGIPGVSTPLNWSHWDEASERMIRQSYCDMGILSTA